MLVHDLERLLSKEHKLLVRGTIFCDQNNNRLVISFVHLGEDGRLWHLSAEVTSEASLGVAFDTIHFGVMNWEMRDGELDAPSFERWVAAKLDHFAQPKAVVFIQDTGVPHGIPIVDRQVSTLPMGNVTLFIMLWALMEHLNHYVHQERIPATLVVEIRKLLLKMREQIRKVMPGMI